MKAVRRNHQRRSEKRVRIRSRRQNEIAVLIIMACTLHYVCTYVTISLSTDYRKVPPSGGKGGKSRLLVHFSDTQF